MIPVKREIRDSKMRNRPYLIVALSMIDAESHKYSVNKFTDQLIT